MIRIVRPVTAPPTLATHGQQETARLCAEFDADFAAFRTGAKKHTFDSSIYGAADVKDALIAAQHGKCCFCESKIAHITYGDVEHFRPKSAYKQNDTDALSRPGYFWLAYDWNNLLVCCEICNRRHKGNLFPLTDASHRADPAARDIANERPLFIDPSAEDPAQFIGFREEVAFPIEDNPRGKETIGALGLNREPLSEMRLQRLELLRTHINILQLAKSRPNDAELNALAAQANQVIDAALAENAEYSAMAKAALPR